MPDCSQRTIRPVASMWPVTKWPPRRLSARRARSRLTPSPGTACLRLVRSSVSRSMSKVRRLPSMAMTVRQQPLTATLSPMRASEATMPASTVRRTEAATGSREMTMPLVSTNPVNMGGIIAEKGRECEPLFWRARLARGRRDRRRLFARRDGPTRRCGEGRAGRRGPRPRCRGRWGR